MHMLFSAIAINNMKFFIRAVSNAKPELIIKFKILYSVILYEMSIHNNLF